MSVVWLNQRARLEAVSTRTTAPRRGWLRQGRWRWLLLALCVMLLTLIVRWPATWVAQQVAQASQGRVLLADAEGTLWQGNAVLALQANGQAATSLAGRLRWQVGLGELWRGRLRLTLQHSEAMPQAVAFHLGWQGLEVDAGSADLPASWLSGLGSPFNTLRPNGRLHAQWPMLHASWRNPQGASKGGALQFDDGSRLAIGLEQVSSNLSTVKPLGSYQMDFAWAQGATHMTLRTLQGPLQLQGTGQFGAARASFQGEASASPETEAQLLGLLSLLGKRQGNITRMQF